jgi:hypothetical protein
MICSGVSADAIAFEHQLRHNCLLIELGVALADPSLGQFSDGLTHQAGSPKTTGTTETALSKRLFAKCVGVGVSKHERDDTTEQRASRSSAVAEFTA